MLGFFVHLTRLELPADLYASHRERIDECLRELVIDLALPETHAAHVAGFDRLAVDLARAAKRIDAELADFYALGFHALRVIAGAPAADRADRAIRQDIDDLTDHYRLDAPKIREILESPWGLDHVDEALWVELVSRFYRLATVAIWPLRKQEGVCFVVMPYGPPFGRYYLDFYRPALQHAGYQSIRAWVGVTNELYLVLLAVLISRCSAALADISAQPGGAQPNLNVIHEIGLNMGLENLTFLIRSQDPVAIPSNFTGLQILTYDTTPPDFPAAMAVVVGAHLGPADDAADPPGQGP